jgi:hypothetical protein
VSGVIVTAMQTTVLDTLTLTPKTP